MATKQDYYNILGVPESATEEDIKRAYRKMAFQYHPDRNREPGSEERFKRVNEAYEVLSNPDKRAAYDRFGRVQEEWGEAFEGFGFGGLGDIFEAFFSGTGPQARRAPQRGADLHTSLTLSFEEAIFGGERDIEIERTEVCSLCHGRRSRPGAQLTQCPNCRGRGQIQRNQQSLFGRFVQVVTCEQCRGEGRLNTDPCPQCRGSGRERLKRRFQVSIPPGVEDGSQVRLSGQGDVGAGGGSPGNLYISFTVKPHPHLRREGDDLVLDLPLTFPQAALGDTVDIPTLNGPHKLKVPAGTQSGTELRVKGYGVPRNRGRGDLVARVQVLTPEHLDRRQRQLLEELARTLTRPPQD